MENTGFALRALAWASNAEQAADAAEESGAVAVTVDVLALIFGMALGAVAAILVGVILLGVGRAVSGQHPSVKVFAHAIYKPAQMLLIVLGAWIGFAIAVNSSGMNADSAEYVWVASAEHLFLIVMILAATWLAVGVANGITATIHEKIEESSARRAKKVQTQMQILHRVIVVVVWVIGLAGVLLTFPQARTAGASLLASAGVVSVVAGLAAQTTLGNVFAGLQLAFTDSMRVGDVVYYGGQYAVVEEITLTYVVLAVWDGRRIIVPSSLLTTESFENWSRRVPEMTGSVAIDVDWAVPIAAAREQLRIILMKAQWWDGKVGKLIVTDATAGKLQLQAIVSAKNSGELTDLKNFVREQLVLWIQREAPQAVPHNYNWDYEPLDFTAAQEASEQQVRQRLEAAMPAQYPPAGSDGLTDPTPSAATTRILSVADIAASGVSLPEASVDKASASEVHGETKRADEANASERHGDEAHGGTISASTPAQSADITATAEHDMSALRYSGDTDSAEGAKDAGSADDARQADSANQRKSAERADKRGSEDKANKAGKDKMGKENKPS